MKAATKVGQKTIRWGINPLKAATKQAENDKIGDKSCESCKNQAENDKKGDKSFESCNEPGRKRQDGESIL